VEARSDRWREKSIVTVAGMKIPATAWHTKTPIWRTSTAGVTSNDIKRGGMLLSKAKGVKKA